MTSTQTAILALLVLVLGETRRVPEDYATIQEALDVAVPGDEVSVGPGTYNEHVRFIRDGVTLKSRVRHEATIDGGGSGHVVVCGARTATVEGFVITGSGDRFYAGVFTSQASQVIRDNVITGNRGDGISVSSGSLAVIERNVITDNGAWHAGIECVTGASATIADNYIARNRYGIHCSTSGDVLVINNTILDHTSWSLYFGGTNATVVNNILAGAEIGILFASGYAPDRTAYVGDHLTIAYNDVWQNSSYDYYAELITIFIPDGSLSNVGPFTPLPGTGEMSTAPLLDTEGGYHLLTGSPCINRGDPSLTFECYDTDIDGHARVLCGRVDIGANEFGIGDHDCDQTIGVDDFAHWGRCMMGPRTSSLGELCESFDLDGDCDVDLADFARFEPAFSAQ
jgi:parallel beta-helix repeat protein